MPFWNRRKLEDCISADSLGQYGRCQILGAEVSGVSSMAAYHLVEPLSMQTYMDGGIGVSGAVEELRRHGATGTWEAVGAWKFAREFLKDPGTTAPDLIDNGLLALARMKITNLGFYLPGIDQSRYEALTGGPVPNDGFFGPPVFDSPFGPNRQFYFDDAVAFARSRRVERIPDTPDADPIRVDDAARAMWDLGLLVCRGPLVVHPDIRFEPSVIHGAVAVAKDVDHQRFVDRLCEELFEGELAEHALPWSMMGCGSLCRGLSRCCLDRVRGS